jgi:N-acetylglutamate synthase-like GNAT family acetyltransferase
MLFDLAAITDTLRPGYKLTSESGKFTLALRDEQGATLGSIEGFLTSTWILINHIEVVESAQGRGVGTKILAQLEELATAVGCSTCHINMFEFSARNFFEKQGYSVMPVDESAQGDVPRLYLSKKLASKYTTLRHAA